MGAVYVAVAVAVLPLTGSRRSWSGRSWQIAPDNKQNGLGGRGGGRPTGPEGAPSLQSRVYVLPHCVDQPVSGGGFRGSWQCSGDLVTCVSLWMLTECF